MERIYRTAVLLLGAVLLLVPAGCSLMGLAAHAMPPAKVAPAYEGLQNQQVAVMVWADEAVLIDWPAIQRDTGASLQAKLASAQSAAQPKELEGMSFPWSSESVVRTQAAHPEWEAMAIERVAPRLSGVTRLIYVEIEHFSTRSSMSLDLYRGEMSGSLRVLEIANGQARTAYEESGIRVVFPPKSREEGTPGGNDAVMYRGAVDAFTTELAKRFLWHEEEE